MKPALVYGADEFFGLSFCEHLLEEGVNIDVKLEQTSDEKKLMYLEERLMWLGRNRHFRLIEKELEAPYEQVFIQYTGSVPEEALAAGIEKQACYSVCLSRPIRRGFAGRHRGKGR